MQGMGPKMGSDVYRTFLSDPQRLDVWLADAMPYDPVTEAEVTLRVSTDEYSTEPADTPANEPYEARLLEGPSFETDSVPPGTLGQLPARRGGVLKIGPRFGDRDSWRRYYWDGRRVTVRHGGYSPKLGRVLAYDEMGVAEYEMEAAKFGLDVATVPLRDLTRRFEDPLQARRYMGTDRALAITGASTFVSFGAVGGAAGKVNLTGDVTVEYRLWIDTLATTMLGLTWNLGGNYPIHTAFLTNGKIRWGSSNITALDSVLAVSTKRWYQMQQVRAGAVITWRLLEEATGVETIESQTASGSGGDSAASSLQFGTTGNPFRGIWEELRVWNYARTEDEWRDTRSRELTAVEAASSTLKLYCRNNLSSGTNVPDSSASPANGTISGGNFAWVPTLQGKADLAGTVLPDAYGFVEDANPVLVYEPTRIYQCHSRQAGGSFTVSEGGATITAGTAYTDLLVFLLATTTAAQADNLICQDGTFIRLGSNPSKPISVTFNGDATGSGYVSTAADIVRRVITTRGKDPIADPAGLATSHYSALNTANSAVCGRYYTDEVTVADVVRHFLGSVGAVGWFGREDRLHRVKRFAGATGTTVAHLTEREIISLEPLDADQPVWEQVLTYRRNPSVMTIDQMAAGIVSTDRQAFLEKASRKIRRTSARTQREHKYSRTDTAETCLTAEADAIVETDRRLALFSGVGRAYRLECSLVGLSIKRMDIVTITYMDLSPLGEDQVRLDLEAVDFVVLGVGERAADGRSIVTIWRET
jgi:hypothetical protein